ncbi:MAG: DUF222 domain-containing protein [Actinomycetales bacterium]|nr:DUF222 domain-containing protein [Tetrasphaera sp.]NLW99294.1 DUF222 domain-containing protein [Actinomycetales bacterium]
MDEPTRIIEQHRTVLDDALGALTALAPVLHQAYNDELAELMTQLDTLAATARGAQSEVLLEAKRRGVTVEFAKNTRGWVLEYAPSLRQSGAGQLAKLIDTVASRSTVTAGYDLEEDLAAMGDGEAMVLNKHHHVVMTWARVRTGEISPALALAAIREIDRLYDRLMPAAVPTVTTALLDVGVAFGVTTMRELKTRILAEYGGEDEDEVDKEQGRLRKFAFLTSPQVDSGDLTIYRLGLTPEQAARLEAVIGPLCAPRPNPETGERDLRSHEQRRAEALDEVLSRSQSADAADKGGPASSDTTMLITIDLEDLKSRSGAGEVLKTRADGTLLGIETLRKLCCDADLIPVVLGSDSEALDHGMVVRLFTRKQRRAIYRRDRHCTFPGCDAPGAWTRVHHVRHWADGGPTDLANAALLCQRHHTYVHDKRLWAEVRATPDERGRYVVWDLTEHSYDRALLQQPGRDPWLAA